MTHQMLTIETFPLQNNLQSIANVSAHMCYAWDCVIARVRLILGKLNGLWLIDVWC